MRYKELSTGKIYELERSYTDYVLLKCIYPEHRRLVYKTTLSINFIEVKS